MRPLVLLSLLLAGGLYPGGALQAQQQESRMDKIIKPDLTKSFDVSMSKSFGSKAFDNKGSRSVESKSFSLPEKFNSKEYLTGGFKGNKPFWLGDFKYSTADANTTPRSQLILPKNSDATKSAPVKSARESQKHYETGTVATRDFRGKEREKLNTSLTPEQAANNGYRGGLNELKSIDDVRALLNKSK